jgi:PERQ amino acid-rich with GYF domain-containing protein
MDEFNKWLHRELGRGITGGIDSRLHHCEGPETITDKATVDSFAATLLLLPFDTTIIADAVYSHSTTMDGRHFAEEFIRRKRLADKGVIEKQPATTDGKAPATGGGWNEVAKKGGHAGAKEPEAVAGPGFKVVPSRKKGGKKV